ncbi:pantoate--beta-alanine ligase [Faecalibacter rhinopitheci]|uniref:Pantothenate synthetase n=1 Tax=Faecalibacter rhinopitheci TaxID=2779678 RepID=A0A8J7FW99_9FLAO|nr:pantoate--beta-alanine ligase [Faecalibacter rhinopitheci]MBF0597716.1 pantoate--beta-alanine ligase [Faecalibacter rhinopitheci]
MVVFNKKDELTPFIQNLKKEGKTIGFLPTMGALHEGHLSLAKLSIAQNDYTIVSIFVNPTQFNNPEDLEKYPRTEEKDIELLTQNGIDFVYLPSVSDLYEEGEVAKKYNFGGIENVMEGEFRPGHFDGVATIVSKLIRAVNPDRAYFGEKDFQQVRIVQEMVKQEQLPVEIVPVPIKRAENGLALSSRNVRLSAENLEAAPFIYKVLQDAVSLKNEGKTPDEIKAFVQQTFDQSSFKLEYFEITDEETLQTLESFREHQKARGFVVAYAGDIRLIDNIQF